MRCVPRRRRTPHAAAGDHHLEEEEERGAIGAGSQVRRERKEIETAAIRKITAMGGRVKLTSSPSTNKPRFLSSTKCDSVVPIEVRGYFVL